MAIDTATPSNKNNLALLDTINDVSNVKYSTPSNVIVSHIPRAGSINITGGIPIGQINDEVIAFPGPEQINVSGNTPSHYMDLTNAGPWIIETLRADVYMQMLRVFPIQAENFQASDAVVLEILGQLIPVDTIRAKDFATLSKSHNLSIIDSVLMEDFIQLVVTQLVVEIMSVSDVVTSGFIAAEQITDAIALTDNATIRQRFTQLVAEALNMMDFVAFIRGFAVSDTIITDDTISQIVRAVTSIVESITATDATVDIHSILFVIAEDIDIEDTASVSAQLWEHIVENLFTYGELNFDSSGTGGDENYTFVINTTTKGISEYSNYKFNSLSDNLAARDDGIYQISGIQDEGIGIDALLKTGLFDFDSNIQKQVPYAYIGLNKAGSMMLKTIVTYKGNRKERWYKVSPRLVDSTDVIRVNMGKGIKSRYWQFELANFEGADFELDSIELLPLQLKRRI